jgi:hypothetical protein
MLTNLDLLQNDCASVLTNPYFLINHRLIKAGLFVELFVFVTIITVSILKPKFGKSKYDMSP